MNNPSVIITEKRPNTQKFANKSTISDSNEQFSGTSILTIDISKKEKGIVIKIKKLFIK